LAKAYEVAGGKFDFVLIDGDHAYAGVQRDAHGVWPIAADGAYILFHDSFNPDVARAIDDFTLEHSRELIDFGSLTREFTIMLDAEGRAVQWAGLRLLQVRRTG